MKLSELCQQTGLTIEEMLEPLAAARLKPPFNENTEIPEKTCQSIIGILKSSAKLISFPQLPAAQPAQPSQPQKQQQKIQDVSAAMSKAEVKSLAQLYGTTQKHVWALVEALEQKNLRVALEVAYLKRSQQLELEEAEKIGRQIAEYQHLQKQNEELDQQLLQQRNNVYHVENAFTEVFGMSASEFSEALELKTSQAVEKNQEMKQALSLLKMGKQPEEVSKILGKRIEDILTPTQIKMVSMMPKAS